jgi:hypothetical protein
MRRRAAWVMVVALVLTTGCDLTTNPAEQGIPEDQLAFLRFSEGALPARMDTSFWAVAGEDRRLVLTHPPQEGESDGEEFLEFRVRSDALWRRPDGTAFAAGDSIRIDLTLDEESRFLFRFAPSGLQFRQDRPAELRIRYLRVEGELDETFEDRMRLWRQEVPGELWFPVGTVRLKDLKEIRGEVVHFTGFAIAV